MGFCKVLPDRPESGMEAFGRARSGLPEAVGFPCGRGAQRLAGEESPPARGVGSEVPLLPQGAYLCHGAGRSHCQMASTGWRCRMRAERFLCTSASAASGRVL